MNNLKKNWLTYLLIVLSLAIIFGVFARSNARYKETLATVETLSQENADLKAVIETLEGEKADLTAQLSTQTTQVEMLTEKLAATQQAWQEARTEANEASERIAAADAALNGILEALRQFGMPASEAEEVSAETEVPAEDMAEVSVETEASAEETEVLPVEEVPAADIDLTGVETCFYNPDGGTYYHATADCRVISPKYLDALVEVPLADMGVAPYDALQACTLCYPAAE